MARSPGTTLDWEPQYPGIPGSGIPEIQDLNVLPRFRRHGIAGRLQDRAEAEVPAAERGGGHRGRTASGYNAAPVLYAKRGYVPDGLGLTWRNRYVAEGDRVMVDDDLVLHLTRRLKVRQ